MAAEALRVPSNALSGDGEAAASAWLTSAKASGGHFRAQMWGIALSGRLGNGAGIAVFRASVAP